MTFSITVMSPRLREIWKVRLRPLAVILCGRRWSIRSPSSQTSPEVGAAVRLMQLNAVVFPAPFGPIRAVIDPFSTVKVTPSTALMPPKCLQRFFTSSMPVSSCGLRRQWPATGRMPRRAPFRRLSSQNPFLG